MTKKLNFLHLISKPVILIIAFLFAYSSLAKLIYSEQNQDYLRVKFYTQKNMIKISKNQREINYN